MSDDLKMRALMSLPARGGRKAIKRGEAFEAINEQEIKDLEQMGRAERTAKAGAARSGKQDA